MLREKSLLALYISKEEENRSSGIKRESIHDGYPGRPGDGA